MKPFPTQYVEATDHVKPSGLDAVGQAALAKLHDAGYQLQHGLTKDYADAIRELATQPSICMYCIKDGTSRFCDQDATSRWLEKGRAVFLLIESSSGNVAGYAWAGPETTPHIPEGKVTVAMRISEDYQGRGLATPYLQAVIAATRHFYDADGFWLESWQSNAGAVHVYQKVGFTPVTQEPGNRALPSGDTISDIRLYMNLLN